MEYIYTGPNCESFDEECEDVLVERHLSSRILKQKIHLSLYFVTRQHFVARICIYIQQSCAEVRQ